jgi:cytochrome b involved in lipid metabolism
MTTFYTRAEVQEHNIKESCWVIANNIVYDATSYINKHPGGKFAILSKAGQDVTKHFEWHSKHAKKIWEKHKIGIILQPQICCL